MHKPLGILLENEPLKKYSSWQAGGYAKRLYKPINREDLSRFLKQLPENEPLLWLGLGSNTLIRDGGFQGTVIATQGALINLSQEDLIVRAEAGVSCASLARFSARHDLANLEFMAGIPGTVGGALRMNAGCFNGQTWDHVREVECINRQGDITIRKPTDFSIAYRHVAPITESTEEWFLSGTFQLQKGNKAQSLNMIKELLDRRSHTQPINEANCGSVFRNPPQNFAARLIEQCGLKGHRIGGAIVSPKHANFIINDGTAQASDIEKLIEWVQHRVAEETGIHLIREIHIVGEL